MLESQDFLQEPNENNNKKSDGTYNVSKIFRPAILTLLFQDLVLQISGSVIYNIRLPED